MADHVSDNSNDPASGLEFIEALSADDLKKQISEIRHLSQIVSIYAVGSKHFAWVRTSPKLKKAKVK